MVLLTQHNFPMKEFLILFWHLLVTVVKLSKAGGVRAVAAESLLMRQQLQVMSRSKSRAPKLTTSDRFFLGFCSCSSISQVRSYS